MLVPEMQICINVVDDKHDVIDFGFCLRRADVINLTHIRQMSRKGRMCLLIRRNLTTKAR